MCLQRKKVHGVLRGAVRSVSKRLAVHCIATPVLPLQRVFPHTMRPKQDRKLHSGLRQGQATRLSARRPAQRPATDWGRHTAAPDALKTGHFKQTFTESSILPTRNDTKKIAVAPPPWPGDAPFGASPGPARSYSVGAGHFRPRCIENRHFKKHSQILTFCQHDTAQKFYIGACGKARRCAIRRVARPSVRQAIGGGTLPAPMH